MPELLTQKEQMLICNAIYISLAYCFEYNLHAAPLKSKGTDLPPGPAFPTSVPSLFLCSLSGEHPPVGPTFASPGPGTKNLRDPIHGEMQKENKNKIADPLHFAHFLWSRFWPLVSHMLEFQLGLCYSTNCMILNKLFNLSAPQFPHL